MAQNDNLQRGWCQLDLSSRPARQQRDRNMRMSAWLGKAARVWFGRESWLWPLFSTSCNIPNHRTRLPRFRTIVTNINEIEIGKSRRIEVLERVCNMFSVLDRAVCTSIQGGKCINRHAMD